MGHHSREFSTNSDYYNDKENNTSLSPPLSQPNVSFSGPQWNLAVQKTGSTRHRHAKSSDSNQPKLNAINEDDPMSWLHEESELDEEWPSDNDNNAAPSRRSNSSSDKRSSSATSQNGTTKVSSLPKVNAETAEWKRAFHNHQLNPPPEREIERLFKPPTLSPGSKEPEDNTETASSSGGSVRQRPPSTQSPDAHQMTSGTSSQLNSSQMYTTFEFDASPRSSPLKLFQKHDTFTNSRYEGLLGFLDKNHHPDGVAEEEEEEEQVHTTNGHKLMGATSQDYMNDADAIMQKLRSMKPQVDENEPQTTFDSTNTSLSSRSTGAIHRNHHLHYQNDSEEYSSLHELEYSLRPQNEHHHRHHHRQVNSSPTNTASSTMAESEPEREPELLAPYHHHQHKNSFEDEIRLKSRASRQHPGMALIGPDDVKGIIPEKFGSMGYDRNNQKWMRKRVDQMNSIASNGESNHSDFGTGSTKVNSNNSASPTLTANLHNLEKHNIHPPPPLQHLSDENVHVYDTEDSDSDVFEGIDDLPEESRIRGANGYDHRHHHHTDYTNDTVSEDSYYDSELQSTDPRQPGFYSSASQLSFANYNLEKAQQQQPRPKVNLEKYREPTPVSSRYNSQRSSNPPIPPPHQYSLQEVFEPPVMTRVNLDNEPSELRDVRNSYTGNDYNDSEAESERSAVTSTSLQRNVARNISDLPSFKQDEKFSLVNTERFGRDEMQERIQREQENYERRLQEGKDFHDHDDSVSEASITVHHYPPPPTPPSRANHRHNYQTFSTLNSTVESITPQNPARNFSLSSIADRVDHSQRRSSKSTMMKEMDGGEEEEDIYVTPQPFKKADAAGTIQKKGNGDVSFKIPASQIKSTPFSFLKDISQIPPDNRPNVLASGGPATKRADITNISQIDSSYSFGYSKLVRVLTDLANNEPNWDQYEHIDIGGEGIESLMKLDEICPFLRTLDASHNNISFVTGIPSPVRVLRISHNSLSEVASFGHLSNLQSLDISDNNFSSLNSLSKLYHLRNLRANNNQLTSLDGIAHLDGLLRLSVSGNKLETLNFKNYAWKKLEELNVDGNHLTSISSIEILEEMHTLHASGNSLVLLESAKKHRSMRKLVVNRNKMSRLDVTQFPGLRELHADGNCNIAVLGLPRLAKLELVSLREQGRSKRRQYIEDWHALSEVRRLHLTNNMIFRTLPLDKHEPFLNLQHLELINVGLAELPAHFAECMINVRELDLSLNSLKDISPLQGIPKLRRLYLFGNRLDNMVHVTKSVKCWSHLQVLDLRENPLTGRFYTKLRISGADELIQSRVPASQEEWVAKDTQFVNMMEDRQLRKRHVYQGIVLMSARAAGMKIGKLKLAWLDGHLLTQQLRDRVTRVIEEEHHASTR
ncbi:hypothetical protein TRVA0_025S02168 [Trichomonascus vanleenenianus]|uniref:uncharacterized protein n=1 Tax=Trichomonascus vanleenenianus TaxID=2268995 RepID=UPI003ECAB4FB